MLGRLEKAVGSSKNRQYSSLAKAVLSSQDKKLPSDLIEKIEFFEQRETQLAIGLTDRATDKTENFLVPQKMATPTNQLTESPPLTQPIPKRFSHPSARITSFWSTTSEEMPAEIDRGEQKAPEASNQADEKAIPMTENENHDLNLYFLNRPLGKDPFPTPYYMKR